MSAYESAKARALEAIGIKAEKYAKALAPVGTPESTGIPGYIGGTLRGDISHAYDDEYAYIGTNVEYGPYQELGYNHVSGRHVPATNGGRGFLRPAVQDHVDEYKNIVHKEMKNA